MPVPWTTAIETSTNAAVTMTQACGIDSGTRRRSTRPVSGVVAEISADLLSTNTPRTKS
jgi:hypothetical protein